MTLGRRLKALRQRRRLSQAALGAKATPRVRQATISDIETGTKRNPGLALLERLAAALEVEVQELFKEEGKTSSTWVRGRVACTGGSIIP